MADQNSKLQSPIQHSQNDANLSCILNLIQCSFSYMDDRINPPSSMHKLSVSDIALRCATGEVWSIGDPIKACVFFTPTEDTLLLGKLAVAQDVRRNGLARELVLLAEERAKLLGKNYLELLTRIELIENHQTFARLGFVKVGEGAHSGFQRPTYIQMRKSVL